VAVLDDFSFVTSQLDPSTGRDFESNFKEYHVLARYEDEGFAWRDFLFGLDSPFFDSHPLLPSN
jgi:hypothetical protein